MYAILLLAFEEWSLALYLFLTILSVRIQLQHILLDDVCNVCWKYSCTYMLLVLQPVNFYEFNRKIFFCVFPSNLSLMKLYKYIFNLPYFFIVLAYARELCSCCILFSIKNIEFEQDVATERWGQKYNQLHKNVFCLDFDSHVQINTSSFFFKKVIKIVIFSIRYKFDDVIKIYVQQVASTGTTIILNCTYFSQRCTQFQ